LKAHRAEMSDRTEIARAAAIGIVARAYRWDRFVISLFRLSGAADGDGGWGYTVASYGMMVRAGPRETDLEAWQVASGSDPAWTMEQADAAARAAVQVEEEAVLAALAAREERGDGGDGDEGEGH
jgi:hypothetical protein